MRKLKQANNRKENKRKQLGLNTHRFLLENYNPVSDCMGIETITTIASITQLLVWRVDNECESDGKRCRQTMLNEPNDLTKLYFKHEIFKCLP